jgi:hypothetical protein
MFNLQAVEPRSCKEHRSESVSQLCAWTSQQLWLLVQETTSLKRQLSTSSSRFGFYKKCVHKHKIVRMIYVGTYKNLNISDTVTRQSNGQQFKAHRDITLGYVDEVVGDNTLAGTALRLRCRRHVRTTSQDKCLG